MFTNPPYISISWLIFKIYWNALTAKVSGHLYDSNIKQHKEVDGSCPKGFVLPFKTFLNAHLKVDFMPSNEGYPSKVCSGIKMEKLAMSTKSLYKNPPL